MSFGERIEIKSRREIEKMRDIGRATAEILLELRERAQPGVTTGELNEIAIKALGKRGLNSPFLGYAPGGVAPYPAVLCASVNDEIVHGIPGPRVLREGDIISLDFGVESRGWHGDSAVTIAVAAAREVIAKQMTAADGNKLIEDAIDTVDAKLH